jgi:hypothetical protein
MTLAEPIQSECVPPNQPRYHRRLFSQLKAAVRYTPYHTERILYCIRNGLISVKYVHCSMGIRAHFKHGQTQKWDRAVGLRLPKPHTEEFDRVIDDQLVDIAVGTHVVTWFTQIEDVVLRTRSPVDYLRRDQPIGLALFSRSLCYRQSATFALIPLENSLA